jgi:hypothetical protein
MGPSHIWKVVHLPGALIVADPREAAALVADAVEEMEKFFAGNAGG